MEFEKVQTSYPYSIRGKGLAVGFHLGLLVSLPLAAGSSFTPLGLSFLGNLGAVAPRS